MDFIKFVWYLDDINGSWAFHKNCTQLWFLLWKMYKPFKSATFKTYVLINIKNKMYVWKIYLRKR